MLLAQTVLTLFFLLMGYLTLRRKKNRLTITFAGFFIFEALGFIFGIIYLPFKINPYATIFYYCATFFIFFAPAFLIAFLLLLIKSGIIFTYSKQMLFFLVDFLVFLLILLIPGILFGGLYINETSDWRPQYTLPFFIIMNIYVSFGAFGPIMYLSFLIYKQFKNPNLKGRWISFLGAYWASGLSSMGLCCIYFGKTSHFDWSGDLSHSVRQYTDI